MKILIAGGCGYVGTMLAAYLYNRNYDITIIDKMFFGNDVRVPVKIIKKDLFDLVDDDIKGFEQVIFLAGVSNDPMADFSPRTNFIYNVSLPIFLAYLAKKNNVRRFIFASSCSVYGYHPDKEFTENDNINCTYPYGISKVQAEKALAMFQDDTFSIICLRKGTVCGYSYRMRFDLVINAMYKSAITTGKINVDNPSINRPILTIDDACQAYLCALKADYAISGIFNIMSFNINILSLANKLKINLEQILSKEIKINIVNKPNIRCYKSNCDKAREVLNYEPIGDLNDVIYTLHDKLSNFTDFEDDKYYNVRVFKKIKF